MIKIISPGKLILSGEHSVVYGAPACALAVNQTIQGDYQLRSDPIFTIRHSNFNLEACLELSEIFVLHQRLLERYKAFTQNKLAINHVLKNPIELCWFAVAQALLGRLPDRPYTGFDIILNTNMPISCGMGSSAALIVNLILGVSHLFNLSLLQEEIYHLALATENLQHGYSSGLDIKLSLMGGIHVFQQHQLTPLSIQSLPFQTINSGKPESTTGECVAFVKQQIFPASLWQAFDNTTRALVSALQQQDHAALMNAIKKNHRLLCEIGVVPKHIQMMIAEIEAQGGAAKICGAGSIQGDNAGMILMTNNIVWPDTAPLIEARCGAYQSRT
jgi:mevalonate kinase